MQINKDLVVKTILENFGYEDTKYIISETKRLNEINRMR